jgi:hypothetical protein
MARLPHPASGMGPELGLCLRGRLLDELVAAGLEGLGSRRFDSALQQRLGSMSRLANYAPDRPLILLTDYSPHAGGGGAVILRSFMDPETRRSIVWVTLTPGGDDATSPTADERVVVLKGGPEATVPRTRRSIFRDTLILSRRLAEEVRKIAREHRARGIWIVMHGAAVPIASHLVKYGELPVVATVHDDPAFGIALRSRRYLALVPFIEWKFAQALKGAAGVEVISRGMMERYQKRYRVLGTFGNRVVAPFVPVPAPFSKERKILRIGVLGNTYSYSPLPVLGRAVARAADALGLRGELVFVGQGQAERLRAELGGLVAIVSVGHVDEAEAAAVLRDSFLQYLNYPFGWRDRVLRQTSFPSKLATYIAAGRPLLLHTPGDSTTAELTTIPGLSYHWDDLNLEHGVQLLKKAWADPRTSLGAHAALEEVRRRYYDLDTITTNITGMLDAMVGPLCKESLSLT